jgi:hypothetical protein
MPSNRIVSLTHALCPESVQQFGFAGSPAQSAEVMQTTSVSVAWQETRMSVGQLATHAVAIDCVAQFGGAPPSTTTVAQHTGVPLLQSLGCAHSTELAGLHEAVQVEIPVTASRQHVWPVGHGVVGQGPPPELELEPELELLPVAEPPLVEPLPELPLVVSPPLALPELAPAPELLGSPELLPAELLPPFEPPLLPVPPEEVLPDPLASLELLVLTPPLVAHDGSGT